MLCSVLISSLRFSVYKDDVCVCGCDKKSNDTNLLAQETHRKRENDRVGRKERKRESGENEKDKYVYRKSQRFESMRLEY